MELSITQVPTWVSTVFIISFATVPTLLIASAVEQGQRIGNLTQYCNLPRRIILFYLGYLAVIAGISLTGFFAVNALPPRIIITATLPLLLFYLFYVEKSSWFKSVFQYITLERLVLIHVFRFVGAFFFVNYYYDALPKSFAFIGGGGDVLTAALAIPVVIALQKDWRMARTMTWVWNIIGLLDILSVLVTAVVLTKEAIDLGSPGVQQFGTFPFSWIPAFAPATIVFLHILVFRKLSNKN